MDRHSHDHCQVDRQHMPLVAALQTFVGASSQTWHMPGHRLGKGWPDWLKQALGSFDVTELDQTGDINTVSGPVGDAASLAAKAYGAGVTRFSTSGSTSALYTLLALAVGSGGRLLMPRSTHKAAIHATALLDLEIGLIESSEMPDPLSAFGLLPQVTSEQVGRAIHQYPDCRAVLVTSPDYYGSCPDLEAIAAVCHEADVLLLVDEAHGAHLAFGRPILPASALAAGADGCVQSAHKTLPALTPGAFLHLGRRALSTGRLTEPALDRLLPVFQTSSPSFAIAATMDYARAWAQQAGHEAIRYQLERVNEFARLLKTPLLCSSAVESELDKAGFRRDPLRVVIASQPSGSISMVNLACELVRHNINIEFADLSRIILIVPLDQPDAAWTDLAGLLNRLADGGFNQSGNGLEKMWRYYLANAPQPALPPGKVLFGHDPTERIPLAMAAGRISAGVIAPYPPGIALVWPGEKFDQARVDFLLGLLDNNISINGITDQTLWVMA